MNGKKNKIASIIVGRMSPKDEPSKQDTSSSDDEDGEDKQEESYDEKGECLKMAHEALKEGDIETAGKHLQDWHTLAHEEEDMDMKSNSKYDYKEQES